MSAVLLACQNEIRRAQRARAYAIQLAKETRQSNPEAHREFRRQVDEWNATLAALYDREEQEKILSGW